jgi:hypothetical protein
MSPAAFHAVVLADTTITTPSGTQNVNDNVNVTVSGPVQVVVKFAPRPNAILSMTQPVLVSGNTYTSNITFTGQVGNPAGTNLRIIAASFSSPAGTTATVTTPLSSLVWGNLPAGGSAGTKAIQYTLPASAASGSPFVIQFTAEVTNLAGDVFTNPLSFGLSKP